MSYAHSFRRLLLVLAGALALLAQAASLPVAPKERGLALDDSVAYTWADGSVAYIPEYRIATEMVGVSGGGQQQRYRMQLAAEGADWLFTVHLLAQPSPHLQLPPGRLASARPWVDTLPTLRLGYTVRGANGSFRRERDFQTVEQEPSGLRATLRLSDLSEQSELGAALVSADAGLQLSVLRQATVAVELPSPDPDARRVLDDMQLLQLQLQRDYAAFRQMQHIMPVAIWQQVRSHIETREQALDQLQRKATAMQARTRTQELQLRLPQPVPPAALDLAQHPYVVRVPIERSDRAIGLLQRAVGGSRYYQDSARPQRFYYVPDYFELAHDGSGRPLLSIRSTVQESQYRLEYVAQPVVKPDRLVRDRPRLADMVRLPAPVLEFEPLTADALALSLNLPHDEQWREAPRPAHTVANLTTPFTDSVSLAVDELRMLYDALFSRFPLFHGAVTVGIGDWAKEKVPFVGQLQGDPEAVWNTVFDQSLPTAALRSLHVVANPQSFAAADAITVMLENGPTLDLSATQREANAQVRQDVGDYVLRRQDDGSFRYRLAWRRGQDVVDGGMRTGTGSMLVIDAADLAPR